jgi:hypothetical protein
VEHGDDEDAPREAVREREALKTSKGLRRMTLQSRRYWIRTSDLLLVRIATDVPSGMTSASSARVRRYPPSPSTLHAEWGTT